MLVLEKMKKTDYESLWQELLPKFHAIVEAERKNEEDVATEEVLALEQFYNEAILGNKNSKQKKENVRRSKSI